jgi:DNA helicase HerA-like ATPase
VVRLIRAKGVGVFFVTQNPLDIPDKVLGQLGYRVHHALRAFTPRDQKAVQAAASTMRPNPGLDIERAITELAVGEALVSLLDAQGRPGVTERAFVLPPGSQIGPITPQQRAALRAQSLVAGVYEKTVDRASAYEKLQGRALSAAGAPGASGASAPAGAAPDTPQAGSAEAGSGAGALSGVLGGLGEVLFGSTGPRGGQRDGLAQTLAKSAVRTMGSALGRELLRGVMGTLVGGKRR